ncbi:pseudouridine-5'-phosphatase isoform X1 [Drosophila persimilis]|nr:pseudouridine-5'-phosphatase isoform X1 [Drosophila persimilis]
MCNRCCQPVGCAPSCCEPNICYCIFDLESSVFDTRNVYRRALIELAASYNREVPEVLLLQVGVMATGEMAELIVRKCRIPVSWEHFLLQVNERASELIGNPPLMEGVERLVRHLKKCCIGMALISSSCEALYCQKIRGREAFFQHFETLVCADDPQLKQPKPEPDVYLIAMSRLGEADASSTLVFDGTIKGVQAASDARLKVVMVPEKGLPQCWSERAAVRLETLAQFRPEWFGIAPLSREAPPPRPKPKPRARSSLSQAQQESSEERETEGEGSEEGKEGEPGKKDEGPEKQEEQPQKKQPEPETKEAEPERKDEAKPEPRDDNDNGPGADDAGDPNKAGGGGRNWDRVRNSVRRSLKPLKRKSSLRTETTEEKPPAKR